MKYLQIFFLLLSVHAFGQLQYQIDQSITVNDIDGNPLSMPWAGGINAAQFNTMDLNDDNVDDLVLFDRMANKVVTFLRVNDNYQYAPQYETFFPSEIINWVLLRDYNCDGLKDLFTGDSGGIKVYTNVTPADGTPAWKPFLFYTGFSATKTVALLTRSPLSGNKVNVQMESDDMPAIADADGDGDLDIFNLQYAGTGTVEYHQNFSQERGFGCDSLDFERITRTWGNFRECSCNTVALNGEICPPSGGRTKHVGGKSLLSIDLNGDDQTDLVLSESRCAQLFQLLNNGTTQAPIIPAFSTFPSSEPAFLVNYPAAYYEDVDADNKKDLLITPNVSSREFFNSNFSRSTLFYKNSGTTDNPSFQFVKNNFLQGDMIDVGENSIPAFADYDNDGDQDMFITYYISPTNFRASIHLYENVGSRAQPAFQLINNDFLAEVFSIATFYNLKIQFADMNFDGSADLVFTGTATNNNETNLYYIANRNTSGLNFSNQPLTPITFALNSTENVSVTDVNDDGFADILIGKNDGALQYWKNDGQLNFALEDDSFLDMGFSVDRQSIASTVADLDGDGNDDFVYGDYSGSVKIISDYKNSSVDNEKTDLIFNPLLEEFKSQNLGGRIWPTTAALFNSVTPAIVTGNSLGGIQITRNTKELSLTLYPTLMTRGQSITLQIDEPTTLYIYSSSGRLVNEPKTFPSAALLELDTPPLAAGFYIFKFVSRSRTHVRKVIIR